MSQLLGKQKSAAMSGQFDKGHKVSQSALSMHKNEFSLPDLGDMSELKSHRDVI
jgi:hypothetical protein